MPTSEEIPVLPAEATTPSEAPDSRHPITVPRTLATLSELSWRFLVCVLALAVIVYALWRLRLVLLPVFVAVLATTLLGPPAMALRRRGVGATVATAIVYFAGLAVMVGVLWLIVPPVAGEFDELGRQVSAGVDEVGDWVGAGPLGLSEREVQEAITEVQSRVEDSAEDIASGVFSGALLAAQAIAGLLVTAIMTFFLVRDGARMWDWIVGLAPERRHRTWQAAGEEGWRVLSAFVRGITIIAFIDAVAIGVALWLIGVPLVMPLALLTFVFAFIPFIGAIIAGAAAALVALVAEGPGSALLVMLAVTAIQQLEGNFLYPVIVGRNVELHPVVILVAVGAGGILGGLIGAFLAVPVAAVAATVVPIVRRQSAAARALEAPPPG